MDEKKVRTINNSWAGTIVTSGHLVSMAMMSFEWTFDREKETEDLSNNASAFQLLRYFSDQGI